MSFELVEIPPRKQFQAGLQEGQCSLNKDGRFIARAEDLELLGIKDKAVVLADTGSLRLAIRAPRDNESLGTLTVHIIKKLIGPKGKKKHVPTPRRSIDVRHALQRLALEPDAVKGRRDAVTRDNLFIIAVADPTVSEKRKLKQP